MLVNKDMKRNDKLTIEVIADKLSSQEAKVITDTLARQLSKHFPTLYKYTGSDCIEKWNVVKLS